MTDYSCGDHSSLLGKKAIVTGGARGIGQAVASRLVARGAQVAIWDNDAETGAETAKQLGALFFAVDQRDNSAVEAATANTRKALSGIDILVNNAGITGCTAPVTEYPIDEWLRVIDIDLNGVFYCLRAIVPTMIAAGYGRIVNIASVSGKDGNATAGAYSAAKAGVIALTKAMGKELAEHDIAINCITPAGAKTDILNQMQPEHVQRMLSKVPKGRLVEVEEIASMVTWLCSGECSFSTGAVFDISGGRSTY